MSGRNQPIWVGEFDVACPPPSLQIPESPAGGRYRLGRLLIRFQGEPVGMLTTGIDESGADLAGMAAEASVRFAHEIAAVGGSDWVPDSPPLPPVSAPLMEIGGGDLPAVSIVIGTRNRPDQVVECVETIFGLKYPAPIEVIVVDNGADSTATAEAIERNFGEDDRVRYIAELIPGLSKARNIGLAAAAHPVTAFLSDDIRVDGLWLLAIARGFARGPNVHCVTGFCPPMYLDTEEQLLFEGSMAWGTRQGFGPKLHAFDSADDPLHPYRPGSFANGSNMAYDTKVFRQLGGFDESLGPGTIARGGEDLDAPIRVLASGGLVAYEPAAIGWHADRYQDREFSQHMYTYGLGLSAFLTKHLVDRRFRREVLRRIPSGLPLIIKGFDQQDNDLLANVRVSRRYYLWHQLGRMAGPFAYLRSSKSRR